MKEKERILNKIESDTTRPVLFSESLGGSESQLRLLFKYVPDECFKNINLILNNTDEIVISYNNPNSHICSVIPFMDHSDGFQVRILFMRHGGQIGEKILVKFLDKDLKPKGICEYDLPLNGYFFLSPTDNSKYVSTDNLILILQGNCLSGIEKILCAPIYIILANFSVFITVSF